jgi:hypothetical protein
MYRSAVICYRNRRCGAFSERRTAGWKPLIHLETQHYSLKEARLLQWFSQRAPLALHPRNTHLQESDMKTKTTRLAFVLLATLSTLGATAALAPAAQAQVVGVDVRIGTPPPAPRYEVVPAPRHGYAWAPGYWAWNGHRHVWVGGHWERMRRHYARYEPAHWQPGPGGWVFIPGHWVR